MAGGAFCPVLGLCGDLGGLLGAPSNPLLEYRRRVRRRAALLLIHISASLSVVVVFVASFASLSFSLVSLTSLISPGEVVEGISSMLLLQKAFPMLLTAGAGAEESAEARDQDVSMLEVELRRGWWKRLMVEVEVVLEWVRVCV